jgi:5-histidylcysteine sulfoxide synthase/putative 4-mercaptohistidine N1-methyltranferase
MFSPANANHTERQHSHEPNGAGHPGGRLRIHGQIPVLPQDQVTKTLLLSAECPEVMRQALKDYFNMTFTCYERLYDLILHDDAYYFRPEPLRHPLIFYFGHTATFFINKLVLARMISTRINPAFESMFAVGVDEMSWDDLNDAHYEWPSVASLRLYRNEVRMLVNKVIDKIQISLPIEQCDPAWAILMGIEHERIHLETSSVIIRMLPLDQVQSLPTWAPCSDPGRAPNQNPLLSVSGATVQLGKPSSDLTYGWDNEYGSAEVLVPSFQASQYLISNKEFLAFVEAGGYQKPHYWGEEGAAWLAYTEAQHPRFWIKRAGLYYQRNLTQEMLLPPAWPVEVNCLEANAYCQWLSEQTGDTLRLPTEAEWRVLRDALAFDQPDWDVAPGNINLEYYASSCPVNWFGVQIGDKTFFDVLGNVWQWTASPIDAYPGFKVHPLYDDFSTPTFDGKHNLIKGGSWISTGNEALKHSRYAFRRHFFQHAGFRIVSSSAKQLPGVCVNTYETDELVAQYLEFHYGSEYFNTPNYPQAVVSACLGYIPEPQRQRALDLGCAVGRASFELACYFQAVDGIDFSARFIQCGAKMQEMGCIRYAVPTEGELVEYKECALNDLGLSDSANRVSFSQGDAGNLRQQFTDYDLVLASNLIDRLPRPESFLNSISARIRPGGLLVLTSPYTWLAEFTEKQNWLGGFKRDGENVTTLRTLEEVLSRDFEFVASQDIPFVIRETARKHQHTIAELTIWRRRA